MSYLTQSKLAADPAITQRVTACAATLGIPDPGYWAQQHAWELSTQPRWVEKYAAGGSDPGANENAITDAMILTAVQALTTEPEGPTNLAGPSPFEKGES